MRVIAGELKGRRYEVPKTRIVRPTTDRVREALFSRLETLISFEGICVLDLYAGSGSLGIEAISRGAAFVVFVEQDPELASALAENLRALGITERGIVLRVPVERGFEQMRKALLSRTSSGGEQQSFQLVFIDPPYATHPGTALGAKLADCKLVSRGTLLVTESDKHSDTSFEGRTAESGLKLTLLQQKSYGATVLHIFLYQGEQLT